jgi:hypothetical protein
MKEAEAQRSCSWGEAPSNSGNMPGRDQLLKMPAAQNTTPLRLC